MSKHEDQKRKIQALFDCADVYGFELTEPVVRTYMRLLDNVAPAIFENAIDWHMVDPKRGAFFPRPADIVAKCISKIPGHPAADEAWAIANRSYDENDSVVWTQFIEHARNVAMTIYFDGDVVGARMAFKACYQRLLDTQGHIGPMWRLSLGHDPESRVEAITQAREIGAISADAAAKLLPSSPSDKTITNIAGFLGGDKNANVLMLEDLDGDTTEAKRRALAEIREIIENKNKKAEDGEKARGEAIKDDLDARKARARQALKDYEDQRSDNNGNGS